MNRFIKTPKGTELPLLNLKGKSYLQVAHRLVWFIEEVKSYRIETEMVTLTDTFAVAKVTIKTYDEGGNVIKQAQDFKSESLKHFPDFIEKSVTGALGRALAQLGHGTAYALADLDEGDRIVDAPQEKLDLKSNVVEIDAPKKVIGSFNQDKKVADESDW